jgi:hypothetical protein
MIKEQKKIATPRRKDPKSKSFSLGVFASWRETSSFAGGRNSHEGQVARLPRYLCLLFALMPVAGLADEAGLADLLGRIRQSGPAEFRYEETRKLELASSLWQGQGYMLSGADGSLVKLQLLPKRVIMVIAEGRMYYWDPEQKQRHTAPLGHAGQASGQITVFRTILQGHAEELKPTYDFAPEKHGKRWTLRVTPKPGQSDEDGSSIEISGDENERKRQILIIQPDGESTEYRMEKTAEGQRLEYSIQRLLLEAAGE